MKKIYIILILSFSLQNLHGQRLNIEYNFGYGNYKLADLKKFQTELLDYFSGFPLKNVENFPASFYNSINLDLRITGDHYIGINGTFLTTGARNSLKDYSGQIRQDVILKGYKIGFDYKVLFYSFGRSDFYFQVKAGLIYSKMEFEELYEIYQVYSSDNLYEFNGRNLFLEPTIGFRHFVIKNIAFNITVGYERNFKTELKYNDESVDLYLTHTDGKNVKLDWSGFRTGIGFIIII